ncbi:unnamed protein product [Lactuca virosa]|uniref:MATH domain-containing protein n=1 Tax=Lactuca virosa TaxID=75947 RepID=A0AAU9MMI1_9ASTR|nr:unnamed protein product [Lactuca virosa]
MAGSSSEESGVGRMSNGQQLSGEALAEWRSSEQVENGIASTSPPYWDTDDDDDDDDCGAKPSELYGKYTWKIDKFSQINKRELRSNAFEVGGYKWYILIYPQGCDVCNHLSLFLCVANHDKLLPGWSHFAQFTIAVVNKDPKKSKYSDTLHRFWKKEHDWGWKKFMELSKVLDGFVDADTLKIKAQVQVIRERIDRPFRCLDCQYRRELVRVYLSNVEQICRRFVEERRGRLGKLIEDKVRWSSFCTFWLGIDQNARRRMSREKSDLILKVAVKHFFIEKEVTSTLVMDSLYSGLKALEGQSQTKNKAKGKCLDAEELPLPLPLPVPIVRVEKDTFILVDDVLLLLERAALEPLPPKDEKGPQNRTKDGGSGEDFSKDSIERDERRLTELGRRTIEIFVLAHIFSSKIEVAYQEAVALKRQEELIREEEEAWMTGIEQKAKREKEKKSKKKQGKQKRNNRKLKDKIKEEKANTVVIQDKPQLSIDEAEDLLLLEKSDISDVSDSVECVPLVLQPDSDERDSSQVNWDTDTSEAQPPTEAASSGGASCLTTVTTSPPSMMDDSSSTCSTDSVPSLVSNRSYKGQKSQPPKTNLQKTISSVKTLNTDKNVVPVNTKSGTGTLKQADKPVEPAVPMVSRPLSAPLVPGSRSRSGPGPILPVAATVHAAPFLPRSMSAAGRLGADVSPAQSYRNVMMGGGATATSTSFNQTINPSNLYSPVPMMTSSSSSSMFLHDGFEMVEDSRMLSFGVGGVNVNVNDPYLDQFCNEVPGGRMLADEFPHLDIINDLLDDEVSPLFHGPHHLTRQLTYPGGSVDQSYHDVLHHNYDYTGGPHQQPNLQAAAYMNMNGLIHSQWQMSGSDVSYPSSSFMRNMDDNDGMYDYHHHHHHHSDYSNNTMMGVNGYTVYHRPSNGQ